MNDQVNIDETVEGRERRRGVLILSVVVAVVIAAIILQRCEASSDEAIVAPSGPDGELAGMVGIRARPILPEWFTSALNDYWIGVGNEPLPSYDYAAETFDAVVVVALAAEAAGSDGGDLADRITTVTRDGVPCSEFAQCLTLIRDGQDVDFDGVSGPLTMNGDGDILEAQYSVFSYNAENRLDEEAAGVRISTPLPSFDRPDSTAVSRRTGDGVLKIGGFLPETGSLAPYGPSMSAAAGYAVSIINDAGGVLGVLVDYVGLDSGDTSTSIPETNIESLIAQDVDVVVGAASSTVTQIVLENVINAGIVMISPSNTSVRLTDITDQGLYFRISPADDLQGAVLASMIVEAGHESVYVVAVDDEYGRGIYTALKEGLETSGIRVVGEYLYDSVEAAQAVDAAAIRESKPTAVVLLTYSEGANVLKALVDEQFGPKYVATFGVDGNTGDFFGENYDALRSSPIQ